MDRTRRRSRLLIVAAGIALVLGAADAQVTGPPLRGLRWLAPGSDAARILTQRPTECLTPPTDPEGAYLAEVGRAAFRNPLLLGGQAARVGLACDACHRNGRTNPDFAFPGVSGPPGTADVTSFVFSSHRGDHLTDPRPIPDLGGPKSALKVSQSPSSPALKKFIRGLVTEEFDGHPPSESVLEGLAAYVRALGSPGCGRAPSESVTAGAAIADVGRAVSVARSALLRRDSATAVVMLQAARVGLGDLSERYYGGRLEPQRRQITSAARDLALIAQHASASPTEAAQLLAAWTVAGRSWQRDVLGAESRSLYNRRLLTLALRNRG